MCGIVGVIGSPKAYEKTIESLNRLEYRGYDSAGIGVKDGHKIEIRKDIGYVNNVFTHDMPLLKGQMAIGHTRWATQGEVTKENAHPHIDCTGQIAIVHNGVIDNYQALLESLQESDGKHNIRSQCDSEIIAHLLEWTALPLRDAMFVVAEQLVGQFAVVAISSHDDELVAMRRGNPLILGLADKCTYIASDPVAFPDEVKSIVFIGDNELVEIHPTSFTLYDLDTCKVIVRKPEPYTPSVIEKTGTGYRMETEMKQQPTVIRAIANSDKDLYMRLAFKIARAQNVILIGCGSSRHAALAGRVAISQIAQKFTEVLVASELEEFGESINNQTMIIALSQSGETADVIRAVQFARQQGAPVISLINALNSSLSRISNDVLPLYCGNEISVAATKSFTAQMCSLFLLSYAMDCNYEKGVAELKNLADILDQQLIDIPKSIEAVIDQLKDQEHMYYLGRGVNYPLACEGALKMKEIAYIHAESFSSGELKH